MNLDHIHDAVANIEQHYQQKSNPGPEADTPATAVIEDGLRCRITAPDGEAVFTDMPAAVGGGASANSPGWMMRAAIASCDATLLTMRAARIGMQLERVEVCVEASSDGRGMLLDEGISAGSSEMCIRFRVTATHASAAEIQALVDWVVAHSPVGTDIARAVNVRTEIEAG
jgi:uncharacterized OsmC-like protein